MLDYISLDDASGAAVLFHETDLRAVYEASGFVPGLTVRQSRRVRPQGHGSLDDSKFLDGRAFVVNGEAWGADGPAALAEWNALSAPMLDTLDAPALLKWGVGGLDLQSLVKVASLTDPTLDGSALLEYQAQFWAEDPRLYAQALDTVEGETLSVAAGGKVYPYTYPRRYNASSGGAAVVTNPGTAPTPPILRVYGWCVSPTIRLLTTGQEIRLVGEIGAGDFVEIDVAARKVRLNGATPRMNLYNPSGSRWWEVPRGTHTVQLLASNFDASARVDVLTRAAYL